MNDELYEEVKNDINQLLKEKTELYVVQAIYVEQRSPELSFRRKIIPISSDSSPNPKWDVQKNKKKGLLKEIEPLYVKRADLREDQRSGYYKEMETEIFVHDEPFKVFDKKVGSKTEIKTPSKKAGKVTLPNKVRTSKKIDDIKDLKEL